MPRSKTAPRELFSTLARILKKHRNLRKKVTFNRYGVVLSVQDGIVLASGLKKVGITEVVKMSNKLKGLVSTLERDYVRICLMGPETKIKPGSIITRTKKFITVPVGHSLLGRIVDSLGRPIDGKGKLLQKKTRSKVTFRNLKDSFSRYFTNTITYEKGVIGRPIKKTKRKNKKVKKIVTKIKPIAVKPVEKKKRGRKPKVESKQKIKPATKVKRVLKKRRVINLKKKFHALTYLLGITKQVRNNRRKTQTLLKTLRVERPAPGIMARRSIHEALLTGTKVIDGVIPIGRGQRELILGDRTTGKTTIAIDAILSQADHNLKNPSDRIYSIYVAIGQRQSKVQEVVNVLQRKGALKDSIVVFAPSYAPAVLQFIAPYTGTTIGEYFRDKGQHALVIYDDLTKHAQIHRQLSLLLKTPPGREAYPGDIFYVHARLLERSAKLSERKLSGSLTALPVIETFDGDATSYIPTNVISITDGQIYLRQDLFFSGIKPAVNINFSVSRVGSAAQIETMQQLCGRLKLQMALYNDYKMFARFTSDLDPSIKQMLVRGDRLLELFKQKANVPLTVQKQILSLYSGLKGFLDNVPLSKIADFEKKLHIYAEQNPLWFPYYLMLEDEIDELLVNTLIACFITCEYV